MRRYEFIRLAPKVYTELANRARNATPFLIWQTCSICVLQPSTGAIDHRNLYNITAGGVDSDGLLRLIKQGQSEDIHQALNMTKTDKF